MENILWKFHTWPCTAKGDSYYKYYVWSVKVLLISLISLSYGISHTFLFRLESVLSAQLPKWIVHVFCVCIEFCVSGCVMCNRLRVKRERRGDYQLVNLWSFSWKSLLSIFLLWFHSHFLSLSLPHSLVCRLLWSWSWSWSWTWVYQELTQPVCMYTKD